jgi:hypothetical protein
MSVNKNTYIAVDYHDRPLSVIIAVNRTVAKKYFDDKGCEYHHFIEYKNDEVTEDVLVILEPVFRNENELKEAERFIEHRVLDTNRAWNY